MKKIKLNKIEKNSLTNKEMNGLIGGTTYCGCSCYYVNQDGSGTIDNGQANYKFGYRSIKGENSYFIDGPTITP